MAGRGFVDTNVFLYAVDSSEAEKRERAKEVLRTTAAICVSAQVLNEFYAAATRKLKPPLPEPMAGAAVERLARYRCVPTDADLVLRAIRAGQRWQLSHWDALMLEAARQAGCDRVLTENLADGADYDGVRIENPFRRPTPPS
jgi:predicted nucleic acid-binding protein